MKYFGTVLKSSIIVAVAFVALFISTQSVFAATNPFSGVDCNKGSGSAVCDASGGASNPISGSSGILGIITNVLAIVAGAVAVIIIAIAGLRYITSNGDAEQVKKSKNAIIYAAVGLVVIVFARILINFVLSKL